MHTETGWEIIFDQLNPGDINHEETVLMTGNGYLSTRGSFAEKFPGQNIATFVHGVFDDIPVSFTELANVPNWTNLQIRINGEKLDLQTGEILSTKQTLNMRNATLCRELVWKSRLGEITEIRFERFCSLADTHLLCQRVELIPLNYAGEIEIISALDAQVDNLGVQHWNCLSQDCDDGVLSLELETKATGIRLALSQKMVCVGASPVINENWNLESNPAQRLVVPGARRSR